MKEFNVLPTDPRFLALTDAQIAFILFSKELDVKEENRRKRGMALDADFEDYDSDRWWNASHEEFRPLEEGHDEEDIARQVDAMTTQEDLDKIKAKIKDSVEFDAYIDAGNTTFEEDSKNNILQENLRNLFAEAEKNKELGIDKWGEESDLEKAERESVANLEPLKVIDIHKAVNLFEGTEEEVIKPTQEDDFEI